MKKKEAKFTFVSPFFKINTPLQETAKTKNRLMIFFLLIYSEGQNV